MRCWVAVAAVLAVLITQTHLDLHPTDTGRMLVSAAWAGLAATHCVCALLPPPPAGPSVPTPVSLVRSAFAPLALGLFTAVAALLIPHAQAALGWAVVALVVAGVRLGGFVRQISENDRDRRAARTDDLTGLGNRRALATSLDQACAGAVPVAVVVLDLDRFKEVNDGHGVDDRLLQQAAVRLQGVVPRQGVLTRLGGDEFAAVLTGPAAAALRTARHLVDVITGGSPSTD